MLGFPFLSHERTNPAWVKNFSPHLPWIIAVISTHQSMSFLLGKHSNALCIQPHGGIQLKMDVARKYYLLSSRLHTEQGNRQQYCLKYEAFIHFGIFVPPSKPFIFLLIFNKHSSHFAPTGSECLSSFETSQITSALWFMVKRKSTVLLSAFTFNDDPLLSKLLGNSVFVSVC